MVMNTLEVKVPTLLPTFNQCQREDSVFVKGGSSSILKAIMVMNMIFKKIKESLNVIFYIF